MELNTAFEPLWTVQDVARFLGVSKSWVYHRSAQGLLPSVRVVGLLRFRPEEVRALAAANDNEPRPGARRKPA